MFKSVFISAELSTLSPAENAARTEHLYNALEGFTLSGMILERVQGMYKGTAETSFKLTGDIDPSIIRGMARRLGQESLLWVKEDGNAFLDYIQSGEKVHTGVMELAESTEGLEAYSIIDGRVWTVKSL
jgi:hypothetical protein